MLQKIFQFNNATAEGEANIVTPPLAKLLTTEAYIFTNDNLKVIWVWKGNSANIRTKFIAARHATNLRNSFGFIYHIESLDEGEEPQEFKNFVKENQLVKELLPTQPLTPEITTKSEAFQSEPIKELPLISPTKQQSLPKSEPHSNIPLSTTSISPSPVMQPNLQKQFQQAKKEVIAVTKASIVPITPSGDSTIKQFSIKSSSSIIKNVQEPEKKQLTTVDQLLATDLSFYPHLGKNIESWEQHYRQLGVTADEAANVIRLFSEGLPLPPHISAKRINDFLVKVAEMERAQTEIIKIAQTARQYHSYAFIMGNYGSGKSQLKNTLIEALNHELNSLTVEVDMGLDFQSFGQKFFTVIQNHLIEKENAFYYKEIAPLVDEVKNTENLATKRLISLILDTIKKSTSKIACISLFFDEVNKLNSVEEFRIWSDFITTCHDLVPAGYIMAFFITERDLARLWQTDERLERFSKWLDNPYEITACFQEHLFEGVANLVALKSIAQQRRPHGYKIGMVEHFFYLFQDEFRKATFRRTNVTALSLMDFLDQIEILGLIPEIQKLPSSKENRQQLIHQKILSIAVDLSFTFSFADEDYVARFMKGMWQNETITNGYFVLAKMLEEDNQINVKSYPVVILFEVKTAILAIDRLSSQYPTIVLNFLSQDDNMALIQSFTHKILDNDIVVVNIDQKIFEPMLFYPDTVQDNQSRRQARILKNWFNTTTSLRAVLTEWLTAQAEKERVSSLQQELSELKGMIEKIPQPSGSSTASTFSPLALSVTISSFELVKKKKSKEHIINNLANDLVLTGKKMQLTIDQIVAQKEILNAITMLLDRNFLILKGNFYYKAENWAKDKILSSLATDPSISPTK